MTRRKLAERTRLSWRDQQGGIDLLLDEQRIELITLPPLPGFGGRTVECEGRFLADDEPEKLLGATTRERDRVLLLVALYCGLRCSEMTKLRVADLDFHRRLLFVREGKGRKDRTLPIPKKIVGPLRGWIGARTEGFVFPSREGGGPLTNRAVQLLFKKLATAAGLPGALDPRRVTPHKFRHAYASRLLESGAAIHEVRDLLGHSSLAVTDLYSHATAHRLAQAVERL